MQLFLRKLTIGIMIILGIASTPANGVQPMGLLPGKYQLYIPDPQILAVTRLVEIPAVCMDIHAAIPAGSNRFVSAGDGVFLTMTGGNGQRRELPLQDALQQNLIIMSGTGSHLSVSARIVTPEPGTAYELEVRRASVIAVDKDQLSELASHFSGRSEEFLGVVGRGMEQVFQEIGPQSDLSRVLHQIHQQVCWKAQVGDLDSSAQIMQAIAAECAVVLRDVTAASVLHGQPLPEQVRQHLDGLFGTDLHKQSLDVKRLSSPMALLTFPNPAITQDRMQHSMTGKVWRTVGLTIGEEDDWTELLKKLPSALEPAGKLWLEQRNAHHQAKAVQIQVFPHAQPNEEDGPFTYKVDSIARNSLPRNDIELEIDLAHGLKAMMAAGADSEASTLALSLASGGWHSVVLRYSAALTGKSVHEQFRFPLPELGAMLPLNADFATHIPGQALSVFAVGFNGPAFLKKYPDLMTSMKASTSPTPATSAAEIIKGLQGTLFMATSVIGHFQPVMTLGVPRSAAVDAAVAAILSDFGGSIAEDGTVRMPPTGVPIMALALRRANNYWLLTTSPVPQAAPSWADTPVAKQMVAKLGETCSLFAFLDQKGVAANPLLGMLAFAQAQNHGAEVAQQVQELLQEVQTNAGEAYLTGQLRDDEFVLEGESLLSWPVMIGILAAMMEQMNMAFTAMSRF